MGRRSWLGVLLLVTLSMVVPAGSAGAVAYGDRVADPSTSVPWVLPLYKSADGFPMLGPSTLACTATALGPRTVLTSAQCVKGGGFYTLEVGADRLGNGRSVAVEALLRHPEFRARTHLHDVAVLRTLRPLDLSSYARLASPRLTRRITGDDPPTLTLYGWGRNEDGSSNVRLRQGRVLPQDAAADRLYSFYRPGPMLAAGRPRPNVHGYVRACAGDQGGPLVVRKSGKAYVIGVTSWFEDRCGRHRPTILTQVAAHRAWLDDAVADLPAAAQTHNRAKPENIVAPSLVGAVAAGSTVTCDPGTWTSNATQFAYRWGRLASISNESGPVSTARTYTFQPSDVGGVYCLVDATSMAGTTTGMAMVTVPGAPTGSGFPSITGLSTTSGTAPLPAPGTAVSCRPPLYTTPGVVVTTTWSAVDGTNSQIIGSGPSLVLTTDILRTIAGHVLMCTTSASIGGFTPDVRTASRTIAPLRPPDLSSVVITPNLDQVDTVAGMTLNCTATNDGGPTDSLQYTWAIQFADPAPDESLDPAAHVVGAGSTHVVSDSDLDELDAAYLICQATATSWQGSDQLTDWYYYPPVSP